MKPIGIAVIGCGVIGPTHAQSFLLDKNVDLVAACDIVPERARAMAGRFGFRKAVASPAKVFADPEVQAVSICTPHHNHARLCREALAAGKDVLCEKPIANTLEGLRLVAQSARDFPDRVFAGVFQHRYNPVYRTLREMVADGSFGTPLTAAFHNRCLRTADYYNSDAWRGTARYERGGVLLNQAIHQLDIFQWIMGGAKDVCSFKDNIAHKGVIQVEDTIAGAVRFNCGAIGTVEATSAAITPWDTLVEITGTAGAVSVADGNLAKAEFADKSCERRLAAAQKAHDAKKDSRVGRSYYGSGHPAQIADFLHCVRTRSTPFVSALDAIAAPELVLKLYGAAKR